MKQRKEESVRNVEVKLFRKEVFEMVRPKFCKRCKCATNGTDKEWVKPFLWAHNQFLRETLANIKKYGEIEKFDACERCIKEIERHGHIVRKGKKL